MDLRLPEVISGARYCRSIENVLTSSVSDAVLMTENLVKKYYSEQGRKEWKRLAGDPYHKLEFDTTMHFLEKYLPRKKGLVLDAGGVQAGTQ